MVSDKRVFPTKDNSWVTLSHRPMISDNKELEKVFRAHRQVCLLNLPPAEKRNNPRRMGTSGERANSEAAFSEKDRSLFLEICGVRRLSDCVKSVPQTESLRPCPSMQTMVRSVVPFIQRFLFHHEELSELYRELSDNNIREKIKKLQFRQVGKLYIRYQLEVPESEEQVELQDVICLLNDQRELYIQKDHLEASLEICRELVKLFCSEISHRKDLMHFLSSLITSINEPSSLQRLLQKEDIRELPSEEEPWEVPEPPRPEEHLERVLSRSKPSSLEKPARPAQQNGEETLVCWPPRASILTTGNRTAHSDSAVVEAVMKMWPPPTAPKARDPERDTHSAGSHFPLSPSSSDRSQPIKSSSDGNQQIRSSSGGNQPIKNSRAADQPDPQKVLVHPEEWNPAAVNTHSAHTAESSQQREETDPRPAPSPPSAPPAGTANGLLVPEAMLVPSVFQGATPAETQRPILNLDFPVWNSGSGLEDLELRCLRPSTVVLSDDQVDLTAIGEWGEQLVNSFLCHWRDSCDPGSPTHILWCNQSGESGQPYDFRLTFGAASGGHEVYVEVKSTIKKEKSFIHLSANELDFALKERERYHIFRVYSAGDSNHVRLCRIQNLAQHLHTKQLSLYLFV